MPKIVQSDDVANAVISVAVSHKERCGIAELAAEQGQSVSTFVRAVLVKELRRKGKLKERKD